MAVWRMAMRDGYTGESMWERCRDMGIAAYSYDCVERVDLSKYKKNGPRPEGWQYLKGSAPSSLIKVAFEMKKGDIIFVKEGKEIVGRGVVQGGYRFIGNKLKDKRGGWWSHAVPVKWDKEFTPLTIKLGADQIAVLELKDERLKNLMAALGKHSIPDKAGEAEKDMENALGGGQGFGLSAAENRAVEDHAMKAAARYFEGKGYAVKDTHTNQSYDFLCTRSGRKWFVEVKGTTGRPDKVLLTANEVRHALEHPDRTILFVVYGIHLDKQTHKTTGGTLWAIKPWCPESQALEATAYRYTLPEKRKISTTK